MIHTSVKNIPKQGWAFRITEKLNWPN